MEQFDLIIIGSGSGNAIPEEFSHLKIALIEKGTFGGTCLNAGCIPSKMFVLPADKALDAQHSGKLGVDAQFNSVDFAAIRERVFGRIDPISNSGAEWRSGLDNVELIRAHARFTGPKTIEVDGRTLSGDKILVAAGARPRLLDIPGAETVKIHTSDDVMRLESLPKRMAIIGGGFIAAEMGHVFSAYGTDVTMFVRGKHMLRSQDAEIVQAFEDLFSKRVDLRLGELPTSFAQTDSGILVTTASSEFEVDVVLSATGRVPNTDQLDLDKAGIEADHKGVIVVDEHMRTNVAGVWAIGDVANHYQLKHVANAEAKVAFADIGGATPAPTISYKGVPHAVFSNPQIASVGLTEEQAKNQDVSYKVGRRDYAGTAYGWALVDETSFAKVLIHADNAEILGAHVIGPQAASLIQPLIQAMALGQNASEIAREVYYIHPALTEVIENALLDALDS